MLDDLITRAALEDFAGGTVFQRDDRLYRSLLLNAERSGAGGNVAEAFRRAIDDATRIEGFVDWRETATFAANTEQVVDSLAELLQPDSAATLVELAEYAIERIEHALEQIDDSNAEVSGIVYRLGKLHRDACAMARASPRDWPSACSSRNGISSSCSTASHERLR